MNKCKLSYFKRPQNNSLCATVEAIKGNLKTVCLLNTITNQSDSLVVVVSFLLLVPLDLILVHLPVEHLAAVAAVVFAHVVAMDIAVGHTLWYTVAVGIVAAVLVVAKMAAVTFPVAIQRPAVQAY